MRVIVRNGSQVRELITDARRGYVDRATAYGWARVWKNSATENLINCAYKNEEVEETEKAGNRAADK